MSDVLSPVEQARAARWAAGWLASEKYRTGARALHNHADDLDQLVTVESLRADLEDVRSERDNATYWRDHNADEADAWKARHQAVVKDGEAFRSFWLKACADLDAANETIARLRATHTEAEAARERSKRQPRVWHKGAAEPVGVSMVRDKHGAVWSRSNSGVWYCGVTGNVAWSVVLFDVGPLIEVLP